MSSEEFFHGLVRVRKPHMLQVCWCHNQSYTASDHTHKTPAMVEYGKIHMPFECEPKTQARGATLAEAKSAGSLAGGLSHRPSHDPFTFTETRTRTRRVIPSIRDRERRLPYAPKLNDQGAHSQHAMPKVAQDARFLPDAQHAEPGCSQTDHHTTQ